MPFDFGLLQQYVDDERVTDIDSNSHTVYIKHLDKGDGFAMELEENYLKNLLNRLCNAQEINAQFNIEKPILDGTIDGLRIHATHDSYTTSGYAINIRKNSVKLVITEEMAMKTKYCHPIVFDFMKACALCKFSTIFGGEVGTGKTQLMKTMLSLLKEDESVVLISDIDEMLMLKLFPKRNIRQYVVNEIVGYEGTIKSVYVMIWNMYVFKKLEIRSWIACF